jgi:hypothetical protein
VWFSIFIPRCAFFQDQYLPNNVKTAKSLGPVHLLDSVGDEIKLRKKLSEAFGKDGDLVLAMEMSKLISSNRSQEPAQRLRGLISAGDVLHKRIIQLTVAFKSPGTIIH